MKHIKNFNSYSITKDGKVWSHLNNIFLKPQRTGHGYLGVQLNRKSKIIHRLVAETFIPNPKNLPEIDHIDGDKHNNSIDNLEWVSHQENILRAKNSGVMHNSHVKREVMQLETGIIFESLVSAAELCNIKYTSGIIKSIKTGCKSGGFTWSYV